LERGHSVKVALLALREDLLVSGLDLFEVDWPAFVLLLQPTGAYLAHRKRTSLARSRSSRRLGPSGIVWAAGSEELLILGVSHDITGGLFGGARREKPNDGGQTNHHDDDRADEAGSWQKGGEEDGQADRAADDDGDRAHAADRFPEPVGRKRSAGLNHKRKPAAIAAGFRSRGVSGSQPSQGRLPGLRGFWVEVSPGGRAR